MPFEIIRNDITAIAADAIVNTANPRPIVGDGTDAAIHSKAGPELLEARKKIGDIPVGQCAITPAYGLNAKYVIHTVGPIWRGGMYGEPVLLEHCFRSALQTALRHNCGSIAFPLISTGAYGYPRQEALVIATKVFRRFLMDHDMDIYLVVWDREAFLLSQNLFSDVKSYIDENYIHRTRTERWKYLSMSESESRTHSTRDDLYKRSPHDLEEKARRSKKEIPPFPILYSKSATAAASTTPCVDEYASHSSLDDLLASTDAGFTETLFHLIDQSGKKDSEVYKKANLSKQHFSKIRSNPDYKPTKPTAVALAIALELDLEQTKDLIGRAGFALTNSSKFDVIIMYFISRKNYNIIDINMTLFQFDQMTLGQ